MILDLLFTIGQAAAAVLLIYGSCLVLVPMRKAPATGAARQGALLLRYR